jgi:hypothetical protein
MDNLIYLSNVLKYRKYSITKINEITNELNNKKKYYQTGGNGEDIKWDNLTTGYKIIIDKFKILDNPDFKELIKTISEIINIYEEKK